MRISLRSPVGIALIAALAVSAAAQGGRVGSVEGLAVVSENPFQIQIQTTTHAAPQVQLVPSPERLVVDIPNTAPGARLHALAINRAGVRGIRVSLYSAKPSVTRVVLDLSGPEWYRVTPNASGLMVSLGSNAETAENAAPAIGWVSARVKPAHSAPAVLKKATATQFQRVNGVTVRYDNGQLSIHAENATLSEVLFQIQKQTGAEIAIPSGTEQERVTSDFGPGSASEVLDQLLNGTGLNFVVVGSPSNPNQLRSVILSRKTGEADPPSAFQSPEVAPPPTAPAVDAQNPEETVPPPPPIQEDPQQQAPPPPAAPPPQ